jgi:hypothetical protein
MNTLHKHVTGAIERGEAQPIAGIPAIPQTENKQIQAYLDWMDHLAKSDNQKIQMYLDWVNNFLSLQGFADHYGITTKEARIIINEGRALHEENLETV